jgi:hypothetical protein
MVTILLIPTHIVLSGFNFIFKRLGSEHLVKHPSPVAVLHLVNAYLRLLMFSFLHALNTPDLHEVVLILSIVFILTIILFKVFVFVVDLNLITLVFDNFGCLTAPATALLII